MPKIVSILVSLFISSFVLAEGARNSDVNTPEANAYITRGEVVNTQYLEYVSNLKDFYLQLKAELEAHNPELLKKLNPEPPKAAQPGYQILPEIKIEPLNKPIQQKFTTSTYSWLRTEDWLKSELAKLDKNKRELQMLKSTDGQIERRLASVQSSVAPPDPEKIVEAYQSLDRNQKIINSQIQYNKIWQSEIVKHKERYDYNTDMYNALVSGKKNPQSTVKETLQQLMSPLPKYVKLKKNSPTHKVIVVEMITDITDKKFIELFKSTIEKYWQATEGKKKYEVQLDVLTIDPENLYKGEQPPKKGDAIDITKHVRHFQRGRGILTTGTGTTYYDNDADWGLQYVVMGLNELPDRVLAHEFGHILKLGDAYFRGYKNLNENGFEVLEVVPDMTDLMAAPGVGRVKPHHFEILINSLSVAK